MPQYDAGELASSGVVVVTASVPLIFGHPGTAYPGMRVCGAAARHPLGELYRLWRPDPPR